MSALLGRLLLTSSLLLGALAGAGVGFGVLSAYGQTAAMPKSAIAADFHEALDVHGNFAAEVALHLYVMVDIIAQGTDFAFGQVLNACLLYTSYIHVVDLAKGHVAALKYALKHTGCETINLGTGVPYSVLEIIHTLSLIHIVPVTSEYTFTSPLTTLCSLDT